MTGGGKRTSIHRLSVDVGRDEPRQLVLRQWLPGARDDIDVARRLTRNEARALEQLGTTDIPAPTLVAETDEQGEVPPSVLMTRAPGHLDLTPRDPESWARQLARTLAHVHVTDLDGPPWERWLPDALEVPRTTNRPDVWRAAIDVVQHEPADPYTCFIHRDYQHFNVLWRAGRLASVIDWVNASIGPPGIDVGHCRLNLAVLFSPEAAEHFLRAYEEEASRSVDPYWDVHSLVGYSGWTDGGASIAHQVGNRTTLDVMGMHARVETVLAAALARL
jgi:aminoglycoside phosphotransferase (APT) family kinase protein